MVITELAPAKINLCLDVRGRRPDGYHELRTVFQSLALADVLHFEKGKPGQISLSSNDTNLPSGPLNLAWRAALCLKKHYGAENLGARIYLEKNVPVAAGLGGGSSDAAAALRGLVRLWGLPADRDVLYSLAAGLGSDVPFCLEGGTSLGMGKGEVIRPLEPCPHFFVVLANPGFAVSTASVYSAYRRESTGPWPDADAMSTAIGSQDRAEICRLLSNSLEGAAIALYPQIAGLKKEMCRAGPSLMSGSGPTVFTLFNRYEDAGALQLDLKNRGIASWLTETTGRKLLEVT